MPLPPALDGPGFSGCGFAVDLGELGHLHICRRQRSCRGGSARLFHQSAGHRSDRPYHLRRAVEPVAWCAVALAVVAVAVITAAYGRLPVIALTLAGSFAIYGAIKKVVPVDPRTSLSAETLLVAPFALGFLAFSYTVDHHRQFHLTATQLVLLAASGLLTAAPLLFFGAAAKRLPVVTMGLLQYITPILQLLWAVLVRHEMLTVTTWVGFGMVWCALLLFSADAIRHKRKALRLKEREIPT